MAYDSFAKEMALRLGDEEEPQRPPQGGLTQMQPDNSAATAQSTDKAQAASMREESTYPNVTDTISTERGKLSGWIQYYSDLKRQKELDEEAKRRYQLMTQQLAPREYGWRETLGDMGAGAVNAKSNSVADLLLAAGSGVSAGRNRFQLQEDRNAELLQKASEGMADKNREQMSTAMASRLKQQTDVLPNGNRIVKAGTRNFEVIPDQSTPDGYRLKEIIYSDKTIQSQDSKVAFVRALIEKDLESRKFATAEERDAFIAQRTAELGVINDSVANPGPGTRMPATLQPTPNHTGPAATPAPIPSQAGETPAPTKLGIDEKTPIADFKLDTSGWTEADKINVRRNMERYKANPNDGTQKAMEQALATAEANSGGPYDRFTKNIAATKPGTLLDPAVRAGEIKSAETLAAGEAKLTLDRPTAAAELRGYANSASHLLKIVDEIEKHPGLDNTTGVLGGVWSMPGGDAAGADSKIRALKGQLGMAALNAMKAATGSSGLGQVTEAEHKLLQSQIEDLSQDQGTEQFRASLRSIKEQIAKMQDLARGHYADKYPNMIKKTPKGSYYLQGKDGTWAPL